MFSSIAQVTYETDSGMSAGFWIGYTIFVVAIALVTIIAMWKVFTKAGQSGWPAIVPILNNCMVAHVAGRDWWFGLLLLIPCVNIVVWIILMLDLAKAFGKGTGFAIGLILLGPLFIWILGYGSSQYAIPREKWI
jgi:hypothetical protein